MKLFKKRGGMMAQVYEKIKYYVKIKDDELNKLNNNKSFEVEINGKIVVICRQ